MSESEIIIERCTYARVWNALCCWAHKKAEVRSDPHHVSLQRQPVRVYCGGQGRRNCCRASATAAAGGDGEGGGGGGGEAVTMAAAVCKEDNGTRGGHY